jgi:hypothetical protein
MMARCVRKYGKEKTHAGPFSATLRMLVCTWCAVGLQLCVCVAIGSSSRAQLTAASPYLCCFLPLVLRFWRKECCVRVTARNTSVTRLGVSTLMLHRFTFTVGLTQMLRRQDAPRDVPTCALQLFVPPLHSRSPAISRIPFGLCVQSHERWNRAKPFDMLHLIARENELFCYPCVPIVVASLLRWLSTHTRI